MKKILFSIAVLALTFISCSKEDTITEPTTASLNSSLFAEKSSGNTKIDSLYSVMINSTEYISAKTAREAFAGKMNYTGNKQDIHTSADVLAWINNNLSSTDFVSYNDAETELRDIHAMDDIVLDLHKELFELIDEEPNPGYVWSQLINVPLMGPGYDPCDCFGIFLSDLEVTRGYHSEAMSEVHAGNLSYSDAQDCYEANIMQDHYASMACWDRCL